MMSSIMLVYYSFWQIYTTFLLYYLFNAKYNSCMSSKLIEIGKRLSTVRKELSLSQLEFAKQAGLSRSYITNVETGKLNPSYDFLYKIAAKFNISINWLLFGNGLRYLLPDNHYLTKLQNHHIQLIEKLLQYPNERQEVIINNVISLLDN